MLVLIHSSKSMKKEVNSSLKLDEPIFLNKAVELNNYLRSLSLKNIQDSMKLSDGLAKNTQQLINQWSIKTNEQTAAGIAFVGDIYSGLQFNKMNSIDKSYARQNLRIVSALYGLLRPSDGIYPYRLEMEYKLAPPSSNNLYSYWGDKLADSIKDSKIILNLTSQEYGKVIFPYLKDMEIISPVFKTFNEKKKQYTSVAVHSKIARGDLASWVIKNQIKDPKKLFQYNNLGYFIDKKNSTLLCPIFLNKNFSGIGLSIRKK